MWVSARQTKKFYVEGQCLCFLICSFQFKSLLKLQKCAFLSHFWAPCDQFIDWIFVDLILSSLSHCISRIFSVQNVKYT